MLLFKLIDNQNNFIEFNKHHQKYYKCHINFRFQQAFRIHLISIGFTTFLFLYFETDQKFNKIILFSFIFLNQY